VFGYMDVWLTTSGRQAASFDENRLYWVTILLMVVGLVGWAMSWKDEDLAHAKVVRALNLTFFGIILLQFLVFNNTYFQAQGRYIPATTKRSSPLPAAS